MEYITIHRITEDDYPYYHTLAVQLLEEEREHFPWRKKSSLYTHAPEQNWYSYLSDMQKDPAHIILLAKDDSGKILGFAESRGGTKPHYHHIAIVKELFIDKNYRGKNIGWLLLKHLVEELKHVLHIKKVSIELAHNVGHVVHLARKAGFELVGVKKNDIHHEGKYYDEHILELYIDRE